MGPFGVPELIIILVIVVIIFGAGKFTEIGGALGKGIKEFKTESDTNVRDPMPLDDVTGEKMSSLDGGARSSQDAGTQAERREVRADDV